MRQYFATLISTDEAKEMEVDRHGKALPRGDQADGLRREAGVGWPKEWGPGLRSDRAADLRQRGCAGGCSAARGDIADRRPDPDGLHGTEAQKKKFLPAILAGEVHFAIGYSEPEAGTDLASLRTAAVRAMARILGSQRPEDLDHRRSRRRLMWLACRTDPEAAKHKGISILIVDTTDRAIPGPRSSCPTAPTTPTPPITTTCAFRPTCSSGENAGWRLITTQLNPRARHARPAGKIAGLYDRVHAWASKPGGDGVTPIDRDDVRRALGEIKAVWRINELFNWQVAAAGETVDIADAAATKVFSTERIQRIGRLAEEIVGKYGNPAEDETGELLAWLDSQTKRSLVITFGGRVNGDARTDRRCGPGAEGSAR